MKKLCLSLILALVSFHVFAAKLATVVSSKAIIYADIEMTSPIGFVSYGKKIKVGSSSLRNAEIYPVSVAGRIAYIKAKDVKVGDEISDVNETGHRKIREHDVDELFKTDIDKLSENNFVSLSLGSVGLGSQWEEVSNSYNETASSATSYSLSIDHRAPEAKWGFGLGVTFMQVKQEELSMKTLTIDGILGRNIFFTNFISLEINGTINLSGDIQFKDPNSDASFNRGVLFGGSIGATARLFPASKWGAFAHTAMYSYSVKELDAFDSDEGELELTGLSGIKMSIGISYKL
ncbi:hypothetical protein HBN50_08135 [Halobacteriovorax sp. GB3]|uniref:hypothetical protein n=1 Tax=Halobacteriovorax sp. GB3 TaxID=2719615 RepID=UPI0023617B03|nr:hypothetical protein [Halobacteriovorax sp. GB3]MDD0853061.1 hypothetical protein [Halobacteriovorax sp. GB3]